MRIPEETINEIRAATDIVEYIGMFVKLKKRGKSYLGLCPFHTEKTPSFNVSAEKQMYYCFGCSRGGDVVKFVMERERVSYIEAIEILAEKAGIQIRRTEETDQAVSESERLYNACTFAARHFHRNLTESEEGAFALKYLRSRDFSEKTIATFGLGYAMRSWDDLVRRAGDEGIDSATLEKVGLARRRDDGSLYDAFRGRAIFPVFSATGRVIAFGARKLYDEDTLGKYINSPETPIYHKSRVLFGLHQAKEAIREQDAAILVEGYADLISLFQSGTHNVVASSGTALTVEQIQLVSRYTKAVFLVYDADAAGQTAMMRGVDLILEGGLDVRIVVLPEGHDPDSFVREKGGEAFRELLSRAVTFVDFKANEFHRAGKFDSPEGRAEAVRALVQTIGRIRDPLKRSFFIKDVAAKYALYESSLLSELERQLRRTPEHPVIADETRPARAGDAPERSEPPQDIPIDERDLLAVTLENPAAMIPVIFANIEAEEFSHPVTREVAAVLLVEFETTGMIDVRTFIERAPSEPARQLIHELAFKRYQLGARWEEVGGRVPEDRFWDQAEGALRTFKRKRLERERAENQRAMRTASLAGESSEQYLARHQEILNRMKEIETLKLPRPDVQE